MAVLVTGGTGYIGSHTCVELLGAGHEVVIVDNLSNSKREVVGRIEAITGRSPRFYEVDLLDREALSRVFSENDIDSVIHFAGLKAVGESTEQPLRYYTNNISGTLTLCEVMREHRVGVIVFSSSATVYGAAEKMPITEEAPLGAINPYGRTKLMIEDILRDLCASDPGFSASLLRYFNPVGAHESGLIGEDPRGIPNNLMPYITRVAVGRLAMLSVYGNDYPTADGTGIRDYIHVVDLAKGHLAALRHARLSKGAEAFNLGTGRGSSVLELVNAFEMANGIKIPYKITQRRPGDTAVCYADPSKALRVLGWKAEKDVLDMCRDSWRWQNKNPDGYGA